MTYLYATRICATPYTRYHTLTAELGALSAAPVVMPATTVRSRPTPAAVLELHTLRTLDAILARVSLREVAEGLFGAGTVMAGWHKDSALRARVRRLVQRDDALIRGDCHSLAQFPPVASQ